MNTISMIGPEAAKELVQNNSAVFIDIRSISEALVEQVSPSLFLPFDLVNAERLKGLGAEKKTPILVCRSGTRAKQAAEMLIQQRADVAVLDGGIDSWKKAGLPVTQGKNVLPLERQVLVTAGSMIFLFTLLGLLLSPYFFGLTLLMTVGMVFAGISGACGMARILVMMPWNKRPLCAGNCKITTSS